MPSPTDSERAAAWLDKDMCRSHSTTEGYTHRDAVASLAAQFAEVRRAALEEAAEVADSCIRDECSPRFVANRIRDLFTKGRGDEG